MRTRLLNITLVSAFSLAALASCDNSSTADTADPITDPAADSATEQRVQNSSANANTATDATTINNSVPVTTIDWSKVASGETAADRATYNYPFAIDSRNVQDYADYFDVDNATAQHNLTIGMASNEALSKVLDQVGSSYTSHEITDSDNAELIIHTTPDMQADRYDYVFSEDFAKGLVLPIVIQPDGVKGGNTNPHEGM